MDTTKEYITMCEKAKEIRELWIPSHGDYYYGIGDLQSSWEGDREFWYDVYILVDYDSEGGNLHLEPKHINKEYAIWIPRQDQLQELAFSHIKTYLAHDKPLSLIKWIFDYTWNYEDGGTPQYKGEKFRNYSSIEQIWLSYIMETKYNKIWNGEDWIQKLLMRNY